VAVAELEVLLQPLDNGAGFHSGGETAAFGKSFLRRQRPEV